MINCTTLLEIIENGEDSFHQLKTKFTSIDKLAVEISAFANSDGGMLLIGVADDGRIIGLERKDIQELNQWVAHATSQMIEPPIFVTTEIVKCENSKIMIIHVPRGLHKPYSFKKTEFWVKNGADKRRATREELLRLMQSSHRLYADEMPTDFPLEEFDEDAFARFYQAYYQDDYHELGIPLTRLLENSKLAKDGYLTLAGMLMFGKAVELKSPQFGIKATYYETEDRFRDKEDIGGTLIEQFKKGVDFVEKNLHRIQPGDDFNDPGMLEIPLPVIKEIIANALVHRDYFISSSIFIHIYADRVEIISPGVLPNTVTVENLAYGIHIERNPILLSYMAKNREFGYTGRGSGIPRVLRICKEHHIALTFENDKAANRFKVSIRRKTP